MLMEIYGSPLQVFGPDKKEVRSVLPWMKMEGEFSWTDSILASSPCYPKWTKRIHMEKRTKKKKKKIKLFE